MNTNKTLSLKSKGYYSLTVLDKDGNVVKDKSIDKTENVITYDGAYRLLFEDRLNDTLYAAIGTGSTEILRTSGGLGNESSGRSSGKNVERQSRCDRK